MKLSQSVYVTIMSILQMNLDIAKKDKNRTKQKKVEQAMEEVNAIGCY